MRGRGWWQGWVHRMVIGRLKGALDRRTLGRVKWAIGLCFKPTVVWKGL